MKKWIPLYIVLKFCFLVMINFELHIKSTIHTINRYVFYHKMDFRVHF